MDGRIVLILGIGLLTGCEKTGVSKTTTPSSELSPTTLSLNSEPADLSAAKIKAEEYIAQIKAGTISADQLTVNFKKAVGEPLTTVEREKGYSDQAAIDWLKSIATRLQSTKVVSLGHAVGHFEIDSGTLRLVKHDSKWLIDWIHVGRPKGSAPLVADEAAKRFAVAAFLDPLFTHDWVLSEAALSQDAKKSMAPPFDSDRLSYNRGTLRGKMKNLLEVASGYTVAIQGQSATVVLTGANEKKLILKLVPGTQPDSWVVGGIES